MKLFSKALFLVCTLVIVFASEYIPKKDFTNFSIEYTQAEKPKSSIVFIHGDTLGSWIWKDYLKYYSKKGYNCYAFNYRGHELWNKNTPPACSFKEISSDLQILLDSINEPIILVGLSSGGLFAQNAAQNNKKVIGLILVNALPPSNIQPEMTEANKKFIGLAMPKLQAGDKFLTFPEELTTERFLKPDIPFLVRKIVLKKLKPVSAELLTNYMSIKINPKKISAKILVITAEKDAAISHNTQKQLAAFYQCTQVTIPKASHLFIFSRKNSKKCINYINDFLANLSFTL